MVALMALLEQRKEYTGNDFRIEDYRAAIHFKIFIGAKNGNLQNVEPRGIVTRHDISADESILTLFEENPTRSIRNVAEMLQISIWKVLKVLRQNERHAFHYTPVQGLENNDYERHIQFCRYLLHTDVDDPSFLKSILWTDESKFTKEGVVNLHNLHHWAQGSQPTSYQAEIDLPNLLEGLPIFNENRPIVFQHAAHWRITVREHLDRVYPNSWIGRDGPILWLARSPDLTPLDFYIWGRAKALVYATEVQTRDELIERIQTVFVKIKEMRLRITTIEVRRRCRACIRNGGQHFEQSLA
ncbi:transposase protein [Danaus plexippus plexippus]|uniref:Transposase protein n=1 Tax=Danaus plexippus plexippus TaxID=278856 RepID=A0A212FAT8_DANPL|nr:transposase protein [Danaus plexippus plexippus]